MKLINLKEAEFKEYALKHPQNNFHQTVEWGILKEKNGWKMQLLGLVEKNKIEAACMILKKKTTLGNIFYSPRGFLIDYKNYNLLKKFTEEITKYGKKNNAVFIKVDPYVPYIKRDIDGNIKEEGLKNEQIIENLTSLNYKHKGFNLNFENLQPRWMFTLDLKNKSLEDIMKNMESKTRQLIRKNIKRNLITEELSDDNLSEFKKIMTHTSERRNFIDRPFSYYKDMYEVLSKNNMIKFIVTKLDIKKYLKTLQDEKNSHEDSIKNKEEKIKNNAKINIDKTNKSINISKEKINALEKNINDILKTQKEHGDFVVLGGILFIIYGDEVLSLFGGSYKEFMDYNSFYTTNYEMIKYAVENKYKRYNFYGISGDFNSKNEYYGLYDFKRGFGGEVTELIGEFDLIINKHKMFLYNLLLKSYSYLKKIKSIIRKGKVWSLRR